jgi:hypothetical protein
MECPYCTKDFKAISARVKTMKGEEYYLECPNCAKTVIVDMMFFTSEAIAEAEQARINFARYMEGEQCLIQ